MEERTPVKRTSARTISAGRFSAKELRDWGEEKTKTDEERKKHLRKKAEKEEKLRELPYHVVEREAAMKRVKENLNPETPPRSRT